MAESLTGCTENIRCFLGNKPVIKKTKAGIKTAYFDVSWGIHDVNAGKIGTWRHCIAYDKEAEIVKELKRGAYLELAGWITTNPLYNENGMRLLSDGKPVTREYLIVKSVIIRQREKSNPTKQLSLVEAGDS